MTLIDTGAAAHLLGISVNAVRIYACRHPDLLPRRGTDRKGRTLYDIEDVQRLAEDRRERIAA